MDRRFGALGISLFLAVAATGCEMGAGAESADTTSPGQQLGIFDPGQLPDPCTLVSVETIGTMFPVPVSPVEGEPIESGGKPVLIRTCMWGDENETYGAVGIQIGVPDLDGRDVVENRTVVLKPFLQTSIGEDGREAMNVGALPTGGGKGATIFFKHNGYSVMIGQVGAGAATSSVEALALETIATLDESP